MRRYDRLRDGSRLDLFDSWLELRTSRCFQMHRLTDAAYEILENGDYGVRRMNTTCVKAIAVRPMTIVRNRSVPGEPTCISIKFPSTPEIRGPGLVVCDTDLEKPERAEEVATASPLPDLFGRIEEVRPAVIGLVMDEGHRVMSITPERVRLFGTGRIDDTYGMGAKDAARPPLAPLIPSLADQDSRGVASAFRS